MFVCYSLIPALLYSAAPQDQLDLAAGVELTVEPGDLVSQGQVWALVHHNRERDSQAVLSLVQLLHYCTLIGRELHSDVLLCHKDPV